MMTGNNGIHSTSARDAILSRLREQQRTVNPPKTWRSRRQFANLAAQFAKALRSVAGEVHQADSWEAAIDQLSKSMREIGARRILVDDHPELSRIAAPNRWPDLLWYRVGHSEENLRRFAANADIGLSFADAALAETGTVVVRSGAGQSRLTSLMPPVHIALVPESCLTTDLFTWMEAQQAPYPASITLISGPSKTADIEQTLAVGVHGPGRFIAILYPDASSSR
jgi:L-lactate utilization protein LutC